MGLVSLQEKERPEHSHGPAPSLTSEDTEKRLQAQKRSSPGPESVSAVSLDFQPLELWEVNVCRLRCPVYGSWLRQPRLTNRSTIKLLQNRRNILTDT